MRLVGADSASGAWPDFRWYKRDEEVKLDLAAEIASHLAPGEVFVLCECGAQDTCHLTGWATAINEEGKTLRV